jgi:hypothetical protein
MIKYLLSIFSKKALKQTHPWHLYCEQNPSALGCRIYDV